MFGLVKRAFQKFLADNMTDYAASLTYYVMLSLFPGLLVGVSLLGLLGSESLVTDAVRYASDNGAPAEVTDAIEASLSATIEKASGTAGVTLVIGIALALFGASGAFGGAGRALNVAYGTSEERSFVRHKLTDLMWTMVVIVLALVAMASVFLGGGIAADLFGTIGLGDTAADIWLFARWPVALGAVLLMYALIYNFSPAVRPRPWRWITPGATAAVVIWILASIGFFYYVSNFGRYGATYGAFAGAVILLLWLYISSIAFLFGAELNAEIDRERGVRSREHKPPVRPDRPAVPDDAPAAVEGAAEPFNGSAQIDDKYGRDALAR